MRYNLYKVLACSTTLFQLSLFCATFFQLPMFMLFISSKTSSSQRVLGLPIGLLDMGFHLLIFCTILSSATRSTWHNQFNLCFLINPIISRPFNVPFIVSLTLFSRNSGQFDAFLWKDYHTELHENPPNCTVADTRTQMEERSWSAPNISIFVSQ